MKYDEVKKQLGMLADAMAAKGLVAPDVYCIFHGNTDHTSDAIVLNGRNVHAQYIRRAKITDGLADAWAWVNALPSPEVKRLPVMF